MILIYSNNYKDTFLLRFFSSILYTVSQNLNNTTPNEVQQRKYKSQSQKTYLRDVRPANNLISLCICSLVRIFKKHRMQIFFRRTMKTDKTAHAQADLSLLGEHVQRYLFSYFSLCNTTVITPSIATDWPLQTVLTQIRCHKCSV